MLVVVGSSSAVYGILIMGVGMVFHIPIMVVRVGMAMLVRMRMRCAVRMRVLMLMHMRVLVFMFCHFCTSLPCSRALCNLPMETVHRASKRTLRGIQVLRNHKL